MVCHCRGDHQDRSYELKHVVDAVEQKAAEHQLQRTLNELGFVIFRLRIENIYFDNLSTRAEPPDGFSFAGKRGARGDVLRRAT
jgi:hypothetical protein